MVNIFTMTNDFILKMIIQNYRIAKKMPLKRAMTCTVYKT